MEPCPSSVSAQTRDRATPRTPRRLVARGAAAVLALAGLAATGAARGPGNDYCVVHPLDMRTQGNAAPAVFMAYSVYTHGRTNACKDTDEDRGLVAAGAGATQTVSSGAPDSNADATSLVNITLLAAGRVQGNYEANGNANALLTGCPPPDPPRGRARARAVSSTQVAVRGQKEDRRGNISYSGNWRYTSWVQGSKHRSIGVDPIRARLIDDTTGEVTEWTLMSVRWANSDGEIAWQNGLLENTSRFLEFDLTLGAPVTPAAGTIRVVVEQGVVTESSATGDFAGVPVPPPGASGNFSIPLPDGSFDFDLGGDDTHDLRAEFEFENAGEWEEVAGGHERGGTLVTDLAAGFEQADLSRPLGSDASLGFFAFPGFMHVADRFEVVGPEPLVLDSLMIPYFQGEVPPGTPLQAAFVRIWHGDPSQGGVPIAGDMTVDVLQATEFDHLYRVHASDPAGTSNAVHNAYLDLSWAPPLPPGEYWFEFAAWSVTALPAMVPPSPWAAGEEDRALAYLAADEAWVPLRDERSGRRVSLPFIVFGTTRPDCRADCDGDGRLTVGDFACFRSQFLAGDPAADFNGDGELTVADFAAFRNAFLAGCG